MTNDAMTMNMLLGGTAPKKARKPSHKFAIGMDVKYCGRAAVIVGKVGRDWQVDCNGTVWASKGKDMVPA